MDCEWEERGYGGGGTAMTTDHIEDLRAAKENPNKLVEIHSDEELNSSVHMPGWMYVQITERTRRELARELLGFFEAKKHEYGHKETALIMLLGEIDGIAGEGEE